MSDSLRWSVTCHRPQIESSKELQKTLHSLNATASLSLSVNRTTTASLKQLRPVSHLRLYRATKSRTQLHILRPHLVFLVPSGVARHVKPRPHQRQCRRFWRHCHWCGRGFTPCSAQHVVRPKNDRNIAHRARGQIRII